MDTTLERKSCPGSWEILPFELMAMILEMLTWPGSNSTSLSEHKALAPYSNVSRQWQSIVEPILFKRIILHQSDIPDFDKIAIGPRVVYTQHIWLRLQLPTYDCQLCQTRQSKEEIQSHNLTYTNAIWDLFEILSSPSWTDTRGITLELSAHSPSDMIHFGKDLKMRSSDTAWEKGDEDPGRPPTVTHNDPFHGWLQGRNCRRPVPAGAKDRLFGDAHGLCFDQNAASAIRMGHELPEVSIVHSLVIRRQFYRAFSARMGLGQMFRSLPGLEDFTYEPWRSPFRNLRGTGGLPAVRNTPNKPDAVFLYTQRDRLARDSENEYLLRTLLGGRSGLKRISIFENADDVFYETATKPRFVAKYYHLTGALGRHLARWSQDLQELHASQNVDAECFFVPEPGVGGGPGKVSGWRNLRYLSLTCRYIARAGSFLIGTRDDTVITLAAKRAKLMPQLEVMELWGRWETGTASIFRFERRGRRPRIQLMSTEFGHISKQERVCWQDVVDHLYPGLGIRLEVEVIRLDGNAILGLASVIELLVLKDRILHPVSLQQMHKEDRRRQVTHRETP